MSELIQKHDNRATIRWKLLTGVSTLALTTYISAASAEDSGRPQIWIEIGGQLDRLNDAQEAFDPPFLSSFTVPALSSALNVQSPPVLAFDQDGKISFQPDNSNWIFSASIRYGRSKVARHEHQQTPNATIPVHLTYNGANYKYRDLYPNLHNRFSDGQMHESERHFILDFSAGKDIGLGMFGGHGSSVVSAGIRFAQFRSKSTVHLSGIPDLRYPSAPIIGSLFSEISAYNNLDKYQVVNFHHYSAELVNERSFRGVGPSLAWNGSVPFAGDREGGELTMDWGVNAALLFGRQKARGHGQIATQRYQKTGFHVTGLREGNIWPGYFGRHPLYNNYTAAVASHHTTSGSFNRVRTVTVPNLGGFAGISFQYADAKISLGYRADFFFNAIDGGIDTRKSENRGFFGPYASISIGLGD